MRSQSLLFVIFATLVGKSCSKLYISNFQNDARGVARWSEYSDSLLKRQGESKASLVPMKTALFQRAVLFSMLNPQSCGAALAGITRKVSIDATNYTTVALKIRGQGEFSGYEFVIRHKGHTGVDVPSYVHFFTAPVGFEKVRLQLSDFQLFSRGKRMENQEPLDKAHITSVFILAYGGVHASKKQSGVAALEIDWIRFE